MAELGSHSIALLRKASAICQFLGLSGLLKSLLDQQSFCMRGSANAQCEGQGVDEEGLNKHGWVEWVPGGGAPLDSFNVTAPLVNSTTQLWCRPLEVLVSVW